MHWVTVVEVYGRSTHAQPVGCRLLSVADRTKPGFLSMSFTIAGNDVRSFYMGNFLINNLQKPLLHSPKETCNGMELWSYFIVEIQCHVVLASCR